MGTGYTRNDTSNNIADGNTIDAADLDGEFDALQAAFNSTSGHTHDGTTAEGAPITVVGPSQEYVAAATEFRPKTDNAFDLGSSALQWKDLYVKGTANFSTVGITGGTINGTVIGGTTPAAATFTDVTVSGTINFGSAVDINGGTIDGTTLGATTPAAGSFTTLSATGNITVGGTVDGRDLAVDGTKLDGIEANAKDDQTITAGSGLTGGGTGDVTLSHADTSTQASLTALTGASVVSDIDLDTYGHITSLATRNLTASDIGALSGNETITLTGDLSGSGTTSINAQIVSNAVGANELNVTGNGTATQYLSSNGDGSFSWADIPDTGSSYTAGALLDLDGSTFNVDLSELTDMTDAMLGTDEIVVLDAGVQKRKAANEIGLSLFNNDAGFTSNVGDITGVTAGTGIAGGGTSGTVTISHADTSTQASVNGSGTQVIQDVTLDDFGHVTALGTAALSLTDFGILATAGELNQLDNITLGAGATAGTLAEADWETGTSTTEAIVSPAKVAAAIAARDWTETAVQNATAQTNINFTSLPTGLTDIEVLFYQVSANVGLQTLIQLSVGGVYATSGYRSEAQSQGTIYNSSSGMTFILTPADVGVSGVLRLHRFSSNTWISEHNLGGTNGSTTAGNSWGGGSVTLGGELDGLRLRADPQFYDAGQVKIRYR